MKSRLLLKRLGKFEAPPPGDQADPTATESYESLLSEFVQLCHSIHSSSSVEDVPDDPGVVLLGDEVVVSTGVGQIERYLVVHPLEAALDQGRISSESPLGSALMGRSVGDRVAVQGAETQVTILRATRRKSVD